ncbi:peptidoglycan O-acetyltransferase [Anaerocolumna cellulosilytica]|uniref:Peptidoglycan O-acetyltransferase n=1 Tax=Anaerocolumna cellulosilytica TaxID=433286 RepID=A0A6S6R4J0_9FIRM|nr:MBOAT family O-acyltransferase [Anaerocolumna cellulosilytica]MBB5194673.1 D-alanyl-lipoteichoic acid acyltransferase DltB (MBOAT superfamily) [Anaerocolumna cellulosilytica]BCJ94365.1 peptidoglycan O-acetyltransferase [Anaerocolumna cellulosilytica]
MRFTSYEFLFLFLPFALLFYHVLSKFKSSQLGKIFLNLLSILFCASLGILSVIVLILSLVVNYTIGFLTNRLQQKTQGALSKSLFIAGIGYNLGSYAIIIILIFMNQEVSNWFTTSFWNIPFAVPLGLGVITLHQISFLINIGLKNAAMPTFTDYTLYISFFPQLPAGPVSSYDWAIKQYENMSDKKITSESLADGLKVFAVGLFKKAVLADSLAVYVNNGYGLDQLGLIPAWLTALSFTFLIYFELSGVCDMAVGIGRMFQFKLPFSFISPYTARGLQEYWHSFNATVIQNLEETIETTKVKTSGILSESIGIFVILLLGSFWFGFSPGILLWGVLQGLFTILEIKNQRILQKIPGIVTSVLTFLLTTLLWVLFRAETLAKAGSIYKGMVTFWEPGLEQMRVFVREGTSYFPDIANTVYFFVLFILSIILCFFGKSTSLLAKKSTRSIASAVLTGILLIAAVICTTRSGF